MVRFSLLLCPNEVRVSSSFLEKINPQVKRDLEEKNKMKMKMKMKGGVHEDNLVG